ncbi:transmembrane protein 186 [Condylostylus longicornis]|uniref:transmembrane protein 186 n=1 Tax=Condylostylus longicornis TaxID=2530218 RepID=UPI00244DF4CF|nr:transmembrane protein 186 [Condylostylus longicornis]
MILYAKIFSLPRFVLRKININRNCRISCSSQIKKDIADSDKKEWRVIYRLPMVRWIASFHKLKFYQAGLTGIAAPISFALETSSQLPPQTTIIVLSLGFTGLITLSIASFLCQNVIGFIYLNSDNQYLRFSYVDFWGKRNDSTHNYEEVSNINNAILNLYQIVQMNNSKSSTFKLMHRFGEITDPASFSSIFGD